LFELPLIETPVALSEEEFVASSEFQALFAMGEKPLVRLRYKGMKHVLSHRIIYADLYEVILPENSVSFSNFIRIKNEELEQYAVSRLVQELIKISHEY